ncbi:alpha/beta-hydrolase, partial [Pseudovirgaria hyperparasitica]
MLKSALRPQHNHYQHFLSHTPHKSPALNPPSSKMLESLPPRKTYTIPSTSHTYSYISIPATTKPHTLLFLHGFPSHAPDFIHQITHFSNSGYGVLVPDLLGYGHTSAPTDVAAYTLKNMSAELAQLIRHATPTERRVVGVGHDFGATLLSRAVAYHPELFSALVFLSVGPPKLGTPFDVHAINRATREATGCEMLGYIPWLGDISTPAAQHACETHAESVMSVLFAAHEEEVWAAHFRPLGALREFVERGGKVD